MGKLLELPGLAFGFLVLLGLVQAFPQAAVTVVLPLLPVICVVLLRELIWPDAMAAKRAARDDAHRQARAERRRSRWASAATKAAPATRRAERSTGPAAKANHLIVEGWLPFLRAMPPDVELWDDIATQFDGLEGDRLAAAFWILEQPACDRATAWHFIAGAVMGSLLEENGRWGRERAIQRWNVVVTRWNAGFYRYHALPLDGPVCSLTAEALEARLLRLEARHNTQVPRPKFPQEIDRPTSSLAHSTRSGFSFASDLGLLRHHEPKAKEAA
ncbi:hypothetical protein FHY55_17800 [Oceanicola sp. D3]|uniref:hypothetical protein n=1 Tax=Oceanicola sp. D3 TaxID=2587163 RepID=UPI001121E7C8|nr:hypothetical protein [Oceanicola sp. D3]QDC10972.1 hypothetical protein FHY55_17800 [Oceanicola sp. D3]